MSRVEVSRSDWIRVPAVSTTYAWRSQCPASINQNAGGRQSTITTGVIAPAKAKALPNAKAAAAVVLRFISSGGLGLKERGGSSPLAFVDPKRAGRSTSPSIPPVFVDERAPGLWRRPLVCRWGRGGCASLLSLLLLFGVCVRRLRFDRSNRLTYPVRHTPHKHELHAGPTGASRHLGRPGGARRHQRVVRLPLIPFASSAGAGVDRVSSRRRRALQPPQGGGGRGHVVRWRRAEPRRARQGQRCWWRASRGCRCRGGWCQGGGGHAAAPDDAQHRRG